MMICDFLPGLQCVNCPFYFASNECSCPSYANLKQAAEDMEELSWSAENRANELYNLLEKE